MINRFCKRAAALVLALIGMAAACGCAKRAKADATFVMLTAPTVEPIVTPVPTPEATPPPEKTHRPVNTPEETKKKDEAKEKEQEKDKEKEKKEPLKIYADNKESFFQVKYMSISQPGKDGVTMEKKGYVIMLKNITEFKELDSAKTTFISTISHELKTPISAIMMSLQLLEDQRIGALNEEQEDLANSIKENSERLLNITGELLNMTQVESGKLQLKPKITKPIELIEYAIKANRVQK